MNFRLITQCQPFQKSNDYFTMYMQIYDTNILNICLKTEKIKISSLFVSWLAIMYAPVQYFGRYSNLFLTCFWKYMLLHVSKTPKTPIHTTHCRLQLKLTEAVKLIYTYLVQHYTCNAEHLSKAVKYLSQHSIMYFI